MGDDKEHHDRGRTKDAPSICIVAYDAYPVIESSQSEPFGGLETSAWLTAKALAHASDSSVFLLVRSGLPRRQRKVEGVTVRFTWRPLELLRRSLSGRAEARDSFPFIRIHQFGWDLIWKIPLLVSAKVLRLRSRSVHEIDRIFDTVPADVFMTFGVNSISASVVANAQRLNRKCIVSVQSNASLDSRVATSCDYVDQYGETAEHCRFALQKADCITVQTDSQLKQLKSNFGLDGVLLHNPFDSAQWQHGLEVGRLPASVTPKRFALWIGRADTIHKRPLTLIDVARLCPSVHFVMVLSGGDNAIRIRVLAEAPSNVQIVGRIPFHEMPGLFRHAACFISTGTELHEGFPNVFLQAAASSVPILSLDFLPQEIIENGFGYLAETESNLARRIEELWNAPEKAEPEIEQGRQFLRHYSDLVDYGRTVLRLADSLQ